MANRAALEKVDSLLGQLCAAENELDRGWAQFGLALADVQKNKSWDGIHDSFNAFLIELKKKHGVGRVQLYAYAGVARVLTENGITPDEMNRMGITKGSLFKEVIERTGRVPSDAILNAALDPNTTVRELRKLMIEERLLGTDPPKEGMVLLDLSFWVTAEQKQLFEDALQLAAQQDPVVQTEEDLLDDPAAIRECLTRWAMEFTNTWQQSQSQEK